MRYDFVPYSEALVLRISLIFLNKVLQNYFLKVIFNRSKNVGELNTIYQTISESLINKIMRDFDHFIHNY